MILKSVGDLSSRRQPNFVRESKGAKALSDEMFLNFSFLPFVVYSLSPLLFSGFIYLFLLSILLRLEMPCQ